MKPFTLTLMCPFSFFISPRQAEMREDLPQPTVPTTATRDPCFTLMLMLEQHNIHSCWCWNSTTYTHVDARTAQHTLMLMLEQHNIHSYWCWNSATYTDVDAGTAQHTLILRLEQHNEHSSWGWNCTTHSWQCWSSTTLSHLVAGTVQHTLMSMLEQCNTLLLMMKQHNTRNPHVTTYMNYSKSWDISSDKFPVSVLHVEINLWWWKLYSYKYFT